MTDETARLRRTLFAKVVAVLAADFDRKGVETVERLREKDPAGYLRAVTTTTADTPPPETAWSEIADAELDATLAFVRGILRTRQNADGGTRPPAEREQTRPLPPVPETETVS